MEVRKYSRKLPRFFFFVFVLILILGIIPANVLAVLNYGDGAYGSGSYNEGEPAAESTTANTSTSQSSMSTSARQSFLKAIYAQNNMVCPPELCPPESNVIAVAQQGSHFAKDLRRGERGVDIKSLQIFLNNQGFPVSVSGPGSKGNETDYFGQATFNALVAFQRKNNIPATGFFGPMTRSFINSLGTGSIALATNNVANSESPISRYLTVGSRGADVKYLQQYLNSNNFKVAESGPGSPGSETDYFGNLTRQALLKFQLAKGVAPADGYLGSSTLLHINNNR